MGPARPQPSGGQAFKLSSLGLQRPGGRHQQNQPILSQRSSAVAGAAAIHNCSILFNLKPSASQPPSSGRRQWPRPRRLSM
eukprot:2979679-Rhodomonas_salina.1